jgi:DeoR family glycerol-3-phosphate regulon repressor
VRIAHLSQIQTFVTDAALPSSLASICHTRGIEVVEAMEKPAADIDEASSDAVPATLRRV